MKPAAIVIAWLGYSVTWYGWTLWKRWNITFTEAINPVNPYRWPPPGQSPEPIPPDRVFGLGGPLAPKQAHAPVHTHTPQPGG